MRGAGLVMGIDVGWSNDRRSSCLAMMGPIGFHGCRDRIQFGSQIHVGLFTLDELLAELSYLSSTYPTELADGVLVIDGPVGPHIAADPERSIDSMCSKNGFRRRAPAYRITYGSGLVLADTSEKILRTLAEHVSIKPWPWCLANSSQARGLVVAESHPTLAMAVVQAQWDPKDLPSRNKVKYPNFAQTAAIRTKSDWYWRHGAQKFAASILGEAQIEDEYHHDRVAALFNLALAKRMALDPIKHVIALGDARGTFVIGSDYHASWHEDIERVKLFSGA